MIRRYQNNKINKIWNQTNKLNTWLKIEILVLQYWHQSALFNHQTMSAINKLTCNSKRLEEIEKNTNHEIFAFVNMLTEQLPSEQGKWIHYGLTSNDILDTTQNYLLKQSCEIIVQKIENILVILKKTAYQEKNTISIGRTHGMFAEPITIGFKFALWFYELRNHLRRINEAKKEINYVKILGPTGISAHSSLELNKFVGKKLDMKATKIANQVISRDHLIAVFNTLINLVTSIEKSAIEIRNLSRSELNEISEGFGKKQKGSSAMPHKKNPIWSENICGLVRYLRNMTQSFYHTNLLWHERDLSNSSIERIAIPDTLHLTMTILTRWEKVLTNLQINHSQIKINLKKEPVAVFSHRILLTLIAKSKLNRQEAYQLVQKASFETLKNQTNFQENLKTLGILNYLTPKQLQDCFNYDSFMKNIDNIFHEVFNENE